MSLPRRHRGGKISEMEEGENRELGQRERGKVMGNEGLDTDVRAAKFAYAAQSLARHPQNGRHMLQMDNARRERMYRKRAGTRMSHVTRFIFSYCGVNSEMFGTSGMTVQNEVGGAGPRYPLSKWRQGTFRKQFSNLFRLICRGSQELPAVLLEQINNKSEIV